MLTIFMVGGAVCGAAPGRAEVAAVVGLGRQPPAQQRGEGNGPLWACRLGTGRDSDCRVQPRQTDVVDQCTRSERL